MLPEAMPLLFAGSRWVSLEGFLTIGLILVLLALLAWWAIREHWPVPAHRRGRVIRTASGRALTVLRGGKAGTWDGRLLQPRRSRRRTRNPRTARKEAQ